MPNLRHRQERVGHLRSQAREGISRLRIFDPRLWVSFHAINGRTAANPTRPALLTQRAPLPGAQEWDEFYGTSVDPYDVQTSTSVRSRYETTLRALGDRRFSRALEVGCGEGVLTEMLAPRCEELLAVDVSQVAVERARQRMAGRTGVTVERRTLPEEVPPGPFDLILCSEVLYYWERESLLTGLRAFELMLPPGGWLLAVHWRRDTPTHTMSGERVHRLLSRHTTLDHRWRRTEWTTRFDRFERPG